MSVFQRVPFFLRHCFNTGFPPSKLQGPKINLQKKDEVQSGFVGTAPLFQHFWTFEFRLNSEPLKT